MNAVLNAHITHYFYLEFPEWTIRVGESVRFALPLYQEEHFGIRLEANLVASSEEVFSCLSKLFGLVSLFHDNGFSQ